MRRALGALGAGLLFGLGLVVSGMTDPRNVVAFLDFAGSWSPNLAAVMVGAIAVHFTALRWLGARGYPVVGVDRRRWIDGRLVIGAAIFGAGWGLAGYCPGPAVVGLGFGQPATWAFIAPMLVGLLLGERAARWSASRRAPADAARSAPAC